MSSLFDNLSDELFQILKGSGKTLTLYNKKGNKTYEPTQARQMWVEPDKMMISIKEAGADSVVKCYLSMGSDLKKLKDLIHRMRLVSTRVNVLFDLREFSRELSPRDFAYQVEPVQEAAMYGSTKTSYQRFGDAKLIVRHCAPVREGVIGSRGRNILNIFVETKQGERFRFPVIHLSGARAFAQHLNQGGTPFDSLGGRIVELAEESSALARVSRFVLHNQRHMTEHASAVRPAIRNRISEIRSQLMSLSRPRSYARLAEQGLPGRTINLQENESQVEAEISRLAELLNIDSNHALAETLKSVALVTLGETAMNKMNEMFYEGISVPADLLEEVTGALTSEYGYCEGIDWSYVQQATHRSLYFENSGAFADARDLLENIIGCGYLGEETTDKFLFYAQQWYIGRNKAMGTGETLTPDQDKAAEQLADGLRAVLTGQKVANAKYPAQSETPSFADETAQRAWEISLYLEPKAGLRNDALFNYIANIHTKLQEGQKLTPTENMVMEALINAVDDIPANESAMMAFEATVGLNEEGDAIATYATNWVNQRYKQAEVGMGANQSEERRDIAKAIAELTDGLRTVLSKQPVAHAAYPDPANTPKFANVNAQFAWELSLFLEPKAGLKNDALFNYISTLINKLQEGQKLTTSEKLVMDALLDTIDDSAHHGADVDETVMDESHHDFPYDDRNDSRIEHMEEEVLANFDENEFLKEYFPELVNERGDQEDPMEYEYIHSNLAHYVNREFEDRDLNGYTSVCERVADELMPKVERALSNTGWRLLPPKGKEKTTAITDAVDYSTHQFTYGDKVASDFGPATIIDIDGDRALIELINGSHKEVLVSDLEPAMAEMREHKELEAWFETFDPEAVLAPINEYKLDGNGDKITVPDRVVHKVYGPGQVVADMGRFLKVTFDRKHARLPQDCTITLDPGTLYKRTGSIFRDPPAKQEPAAPTLDKPIKAMFDEEVHPYLASFATPQVMGKIMDEMKAYAHELLAKPKKYGLSDPENLHYDDTDEEAADFVREFSSLLRGKLDNLLWDANNGMMSETEELDELSPATRSSYVKRAEDEMMGHVANADLYRRRADHSHNPDKWYAGAEQADHRAAKRAKGLGRAYRSEGLEEALNELARDTLNSYFDKASTDRCALDKADAHGDEAAGRKLKRRDKGLGRALDKMMQMSEANEYDQMPATRYHGGLEGNVEDFLNAVYAKKGWSIHGQAQDILNGDAFEEQNSNALRHIMEIARQRNEIEFADFIDKYLNEEPIDEADLVIPGDQGDALIADIEKRPEPTEGGTPGSYQIYGRTFATRTFPSDAAANAWMEQNPGWGVIGVKDNVVHVADKEDEGIKEALGMHRLLTLAGRNK